MANPAMLHPLDGYRVVDLSSGIAGGYCTKLLADGGADVVKIEPPEGDGLRRRAPEEITLAAGEDGALFTFLACSKRSIVADPDVPEDLAAVHAYLASADAIVWSPGSRLAEHPSLRPEALRTLAPNATVTSITDWGLEGRWGGSAGDRGDAAGPRRRPDAPRRPQAAAHDRTSGGSGRRCSTVRTRTSST